MLFQPSNIIPDEINGTGTVDVSNGLSVAWQVNGDTPMTAWQINIYANTAQSALLYSTGMQTLSAPFWGTNYAGETQFFSTDISASDLSGAGITNGSEYKLIITQWWSASDSISQTTASVFLTRSTPTVAITQIPSPVPDKSYTFTGTYTQAQGDPIKWLRWQIAETSNIAEPFLDTGRITGTGQLQVSYDGFYTGTDYSILLEIETANGVSATTGWVNFSVSYTLGATTSQVTVCQLADDSCVFISWGFVENALGYAVFRRRIGDSVLIKLAEVDSTTGALRDYSAASGNSYVYYIFPTGQTTYITDPMISQEVYVSFGFWSIIEAAPGDNGAFNVIATYLFRMGTGGVQIGQFSNNNGPNLLRNFTKYPLRQPENANFLTGTVSGFVGTILPETKQYSDTTDQVNNLLLLSNSTNALFYLDPKGNFLRVHTGDAITFSMDTAKNVLPQTLTFPWVQVASASGVSVISAPGGEFYPTDRIIFTTLSVDPQTGLLIWRVPAGYGDGSTLSLNAQGQLVQDAQGSFTAASMAWDVSTGIVTATI